MLLNNQLIKEGPQHPLVDFDTIGPFGEGRQLQIETTIHLSVLEGDNKYLTYTVNGEKGITHKAFV
jgi:hypothetical protein